MTPSDLAARIDHTILKPEALPADVDRVVAEALQHGFASACVAGVFVGRAARQIRPNSEEPVTTSGGKIFGGPVICAVVGFPNGTEKATVKAIEATAAIKDGAAEVDMVLHLPFLLARDVAAARAEVQEVVRAARATLPDVVIKVIVESAALLKFGEGSAEQLIADACQAVREGGADYIKTSTGFHPAGGASVEAVTLMKKHAGGLKVKASGGIRTLAAALEMIDAGADRLGLSASVDILKEAKGEAANSGGAEGY